MPVIVSHALVGLLPVLLFLLLLVWLDSYKLVSVRLVLAVMLWGVAAAIACYFVNGALIPRAGLAIAPYSRYVAPAIEEIAKGMVIVALIRTHRIGFLIDAAILGFAVGAGFAIVENLQFQRMLPDAGIATWLVRGFGTAIMHGGVTATFAMMSLVSVERARTARGARVRAAARARRRAALGLQPPGRRADGGDARRARRAAGVMALVFARSERAVGDWLGRGFDADTAMLASINSGHFSDSPTGRYLDTLRRASRGRSSPTSCATCGCTPSSRCAPRAC
jgi:hypothetical protein